MAQHKWIYLLSGGFLEISVRQLLLQPIPYLFAFLCLFTSRIQLKCRSPSSLGFWFQLSVLNPDDAPKNQSVINLWKFCLATPTQHIAWSKQTPAKKKSSFKIYKLGNNDSSATNRTACHIWITKRFVCANQMRSCRINYVNLLTLTLLVIRHLALYWSSNRFGYRPRISSNDSGSSRSAIAWFSWNYLILSRNWRW